jgi:hypothetical protein
MGQQCTEDNNPLRGVIHTSRGPDTLVLNCGRNLTVVNAHIVLFLFCMAVRVATSDCG